METVIVKDVFYAMPKKYRTQILIWIGVLIKVYGVGLLEGDPTDSWPPFYDELTDNQKMVADYLRDAALEAYRKRKEEEDGRR